MPQPLSEDDIKFVCDLAERAGKLAVVMREGVAIHEKSGPHDKVTDADLKLSEIILAALKERFPDDLLISEEDDHPVIAAVVPPDDVTEPAKRTWLIDPIDGTDNYISGNSQYSVMIGIVEQGAPTFGWVYQPTTGNTYWGGPGYGMWKREPKAQPVRYEQLAEVNGDVRIMMGWRDKKRNPWVLEIPTVKFIPSGSVGLKVVKVLEDKADMFVNLSGKLKLWDTAAPCALALGASLEVGTLDGEPLVFPVPALFHDSSVIIGRPGSMSWSKENIVSRITN